MNEMKLLLLFLFFCGLLELEAQGEQLVLLRPICVELTLGPIDGEVWDLEGDRLVRIGSEKQELVPGVGSLLFLFIGAHEPVARLQALADLRVLDRENKSLYPRDGITLLDDLHDAIF
jgi:hypothetical protein